MTLLRQVKKPIKKLLLGLQQPEPDCPWRVAPEELENVRIIWPRDLRWEYAWGWVEPLFEGFRSRVTLVTEDIPQQLEGSTLIKFQRGSNTYRVLLNCSDYPDLIHFNSPQAALDLEFKMQYRNEGYGEPRIVPGGYVTNSVLIDWYTRMPQRIRERQKFRYDVYGRFGTRFATEVRRRAIGMFENQNRVHFFGGHRTVGFTKFLREIAHARVCLDLPGNGPFCFRFVNYLAVGACVVSPPHTTSMPAPLVDRQHVIYTKPDMSDLVDLCEHYAHDTSAREAVMSQARDYYRRHLYWRSLSDYYLRTMLDKLPA